MRLAVAGSFLLVSMTAMAQQAQECRVLVGKEWIAMGTTTLAGCLKFADEAATPGERQFAKHGDTFLKVQGEEHQQSADGGNTWQPVASSAPAQGFQSLNILQPPQGEAAALAPPEGAQKTAPKKVKKKRRYRYN